MALFIDYWEAFYNDKVLPAKEFAPDLWFTVRDRLASSSMKASYTEQQSRLEKFEECLKQGPKYMKATRPVGIDETSRTSGKVLLNVLTKSNQTYLKGTGIEIVGIVEAELTARGLEEKVEKGSNLVAKRQAIRKHEFLRIHEANTMKEWKENDVKEIVPQSEEMKSFVAHCHYKNLLDKISAKEK